MTTLKTEYITDTMRVLMMQDQEGRYHIRSQQECTNVPCPHWEIHADGWRDCSSRMTRDADEAETEYLHMIDFERRMLPA